MSNPRVIVLALAFVGAGLAVADDDEPPDAPLLPIPNLLRPTPQAGSKGTAPVRGACVAPAPKASESVVPYLPGENMHFDVKVLGLRTGQVVLQANRSTRIDNVDVMPVSAYAKTDSAFSFFGELEGRMLSYVGAKNARPVRMVNHVQTKQMWKKPAISREDAAFSDDGQVASRVTYWREGKERSWPGKSTATSDLVDVLSVVYYARTRALVEGEPFCFQVYHRRRIWQIEGTPGALENVSPPIGKRLARRIDVVAKRLGGKAGAESTRAITVHLSDDKSRLPLIVRTVDGFSDVAVELRSHMPGHASAR
jgi:phage tail protein X